MVRISKAKRDLPNALVPTACGGSLADDRRVEPSNAAF